MKYYCEHCCNIYLQQDICPCCGDKQTKPIIIDVQYQSNNDYVVSS